MFPNKSQSDETKVVFSRASRSIGQADDVTMMERVSSIEVVENGSSDDRVDCALVYPSSSRSQPPSMANYRTQQIVHKFTKGCACPKCMGVMWSQLGNNDFNVSHDTRLQTDELDCPDSIDVITNSESPTNSVSLDPNVVQTNVEVLEKHWPVLMEKISNDRLVLCEFLKKKPAALQIFLAFLTKQIRFKPNDETTTISMNMERLLDKPVGGNNKYSVFHHLISDLPENGCDLLAHPLIAALTKMKLAKFNPIYTLLFTYQLILTICLTVSALTVLIPETPSHHPYPIVEFVLYTIFILTLAKTGLSFVVDTDLNWSNFRHIAETVCVFVVLTTCHFRNYDIYSYKIKDAAGFAVLGSWVLLLTYMTKFNHYAAYVQTYFQIMKYYIKFLLTVALFQIIGLTTAYMLIFSKIDKSDNTSIFTKGSRAFVIALSTRMNYADFTKDESTITNVFSVFLYLIIFVICSTVMFAMIINLAQNGSKNFQETKKTSAVKVLRQDIINIGELERLYGKLKKYRCFPQIIAKWLLRMSSIENYFLSNSGQVLEFKLEKSDDNSAFSNHWRKSVYQFLADKTLNCGVN